MAGVVVVCCPRLRVGSDTLCCPAPLCVVLLPLVSFLLLFRFVRGGMMQCEIGRVVCVMNGGGVGLCPVLLFLIPLIVFAVTALLV